MRQMLSNEHVLWWMRKHPRKRYNKFKRELCPLSLYLQGNGYPHGNWGVDSGVLDTRIKPLTIDHDPTNQAWADYLLRNTIFGFTPVPDRGNLGMVADELAKRMGVA